MSDVLVEAVVRALLLEPVLAGVASAEAFAAVLPFVVFAMSCMASFVV